MLCTLFAVNPIVSDIYKHLIVDLKITNFRDEILIQPYVPRKAVLHKTTTCNLAIQLLAFIDDINQGSWVVCCLHLKIEFRSCARGRQWWDIFHYQWWAASIKPTLLFFHAGYASWGLFPHQFNGPNLTVCMQDLKLH